MGAAINRTRRLFDRRRRRRAFLGLNGYQPDLSLGDFDSVTQDELAAIRAASKETIAYDPIDKDFTDTELAWKYAMDKNPDQLLLVGGLGTRFDHTLANVHLLRQTVEQGIDAWIIDKHNRIRLLANQRPYHIVNFHTSPYFP